MQRPTSSTFASWWCKVAVVLITTLTSTVLGFNVDVRTASIKQGEAGTMFGFTVAQHIDRGQHWILVGAPNASTSQENVKRGGAVYRCGVDNDICRQVPFDTQGDNREWNGSSMVQVENKTLQWFGASLDASTSTDVRSPGYIVACAPRYVLYGRDRSRDGPIGNCFLSRSEESRAAPARRTSPPSSELTYSYQRYSPCRQGASGFGMLGHCQFGFSVTLNDDNTYLASGAVGSYYWQGQVIAQDLGEDADFYETREQSSAHDNTFMGYAITVGHFDNEIKQDYAVGVPKGSNLKGNVVILSHTLQMLHNISGEQIGEYFGEALAVGDFNGDGLDDLAVGAPFHTYAMSFDCGRVYVFYQTPSRAFSSMEQATKLHGSKRTRGRFGFALSSIGDVNVDGFQDLVVGAPFDGPEGRGAVYIFNGSPNGLMSTASQTIHAKDIASSLSTFGYSLSAGTDVDKNGYADLLAGAFASDQAIYFRSKPVIRMETSLLVNQGETIELEARRCEPRDRYNGTCFTIECCMKFDGINVPSDIELGLQWQLDSSKEHSQRARFVGVNDHIMNDTIKLVKQKDKCKTVRAYVLNKIRDKVSPIPVKVKYSLLKPTVQHLANWNDLEPVLDALKPAEVTGQGQIMKQCGSKKICTPNLSVKAFSSTSVHTVGNVTNIDLRVLVENLGDDAFEAVAHIYIPPELDYVNVDLEYAPDPADFSCGQPENNTDGDVICDIGNPLPAKRRALFVVRTVTSKRPTGQTPALTFVVQMTSSNPENPSTLADNEASVVIPVKAVVNITLSGVSHPEHFIANVTRKSSFTNETEIGPLIIHLYEITNFGPSHVSSMRTTIYWPAALPDGLHMLYLAELPRVIRGTGSCVADVNVINPLNVTLVDTPQLDAVRLAQLTRAAKQKTPGREKRQAGQQYIGKAKCDSARTPGCTTIVCETGAMEGRDDSVVIQIKSRLFTNTLIRRQSDYDGFKVRSRAVTTVVKLPYDVRYEVNAIDRHEVETFVAVVGTGQIRRQIDFWVIALAIIGGCLLLFLVVIILWKCGFFERRRQQAGADETDRPPTHRATKTTSPPAPPAVGYSHQYRAVKDDDFYN